VLKLSLTVLLHGLVVSVSSITKRVESRNRVKTSWKTVSESVGVWSELWSDWRSKSSNTWEGKGGNKKLHDSNIYYLFDDREVLFSAFK
jgi:hypothetical protein